MDDNPRRKWATQNPLVGMLTSFEDRYLHDRFRKTLPAGIKPTSDLGNFIWFLVESLHHVSQSMGHLISGRVVVRGMQLDGRMKYMPILEVAIVKRGTTSSHKDDDLCDELARVFNALAVFIPNLMMPKGFQYLEVGLRKAGPFSVDYDCPKKFNIVKDLMEMGKCELKLGIFGWLSADTDSKGISTLGGAEGNKEAVFRKALEDLTNNMEILSPEGSPKDQERPAETLAAIRRYCREETARFLKKRIDAVMDRLEPSQRHGSFLRGLIETTTRKVNGVARLTSFEMSASLVVRNVGGEEWIVLDIESRPRAGRRRRFTIPGTIRLISIDVEENVVTPLFVMVPAGEETQSAEEHDPKLDTGDIDLVQVVKTQGAHGIELGTYGLY